MNFKALLTFLLVSTVIWLMYDLYHLYIRYTLAWNYYKNQPVENIFNVLGLLIPVAVLMFVLAALNGRSEEIFEEDEDPGTTIQ
jgi:hypothetical protein